MGEYMTADILANELKTALSNMTERMRDVLCGGKTTIISYLSNLSGVIVYSYSTKTATLDLEEDCSDKYIKEVYGALYLLDQLRKTKGIDIRYEIRMNGEIVATGEPTEEFYTKMLNRMAQEIKDCLSEESYGFVPHLKQLLLLIPDTVSGKELLLNIFNSIPPELIKQLERYF